MILYGRNVSPFTRRVAIWLTLQGRPFEHRQLSVADPQEFEEVKAANPTGRVPALVLDDGVRLVESWAICDWLDETAPEGKRLIPESGLARRTTLQRIAAAQAVAEKAVALVYDRNRRPEEHHYPDWIARLSGQVSAGLADLETAAPEAGWFGGDAPDGADIAFVCMTDFVVMMHPDLLDAARFPRLVAHAARADALEAFAATRP
jgi:glutathione S-transferase